MASTVVLPSSARVTQLKRHNLEANETILFFFSFIHFIRVYYTQIQITHQNNHKQNSSSLFDETMA